MTTPQRRSIDQLAPAEYVDQIFLISQPQLRSTSRGDYYIAAFLSDRTGRINGRMWQASKAVYDSLPQEGFVRVRGRTEMYQESLQLVIDSIVSAEDDQVQLREFMPSTDKDIDEMFTRLKTIVAQVKSPHLAGLIKAFLADEQLMDKLCTAPAAIVLHHAYVGGLLEHTLAVLELAQKVLPLYPQLDADLILTGVFLHDIGKTTELQYQVSFQYSNQGHLLGHLVKGTLLIEEKIRQLNSANTDAFPQLLVDCLMHIIVAHHGQREFGCPVLPSTPEAFFVHYLDNLDSKMALTLAEITKDTNKTDWTNYVKSIDAPLFKHHNVSQL